MPRILFASRGGRIVLPATGSVLVDRDDGGHLVVDPPRPVWERSELSADELIHWSYLVAATGRAMIDALPPLAGGCLNYWEAGNWALNDHAEPRGPKTGPEHRRVHLHLLGRSPRATDPSWRWGEAPRFPTYEERLTWAAGFRQLTAEECRRIVERTESRLTTRYRVTAADLSPWATCERCGYPAPIAEARPPMVCSECAPERG
jgi:diadenosine tetraphosphate (Ap4A) HIT family hydrolase